MTGRHHNAAWIHHEARADDVRNTFVWAEPQSGRDGKRSERHDTLVHDGGSFSQVHEEAPADAANRAPYVNS